MKAVCPNDPKHDKFITVAHVAQEWLVDSEGDFLEHKGDLEVTHKPDKDNCWTCHYCGAEAIVTD